jgi:hypothetical protein
VHRHDQGFDPECEWCQLDLLLRKLAGDCGVSNLDSYLRTEMSILWNQAEKEQR